MAKKSNKNQPVRRAGDQTKMPCGSDQCKNLKFTIWTWNIGWTKNYWKCSKCGRER